MKALFSRHEVAREIDQARAIMRAFIDETRSAAEWAQMRGRHVHGDEQIRALWKIARGFADSTDDMNFDAERLSRISTPTLVVNGDRDPLYPVELSVELYRGLANARLWILPNEGHGPIFGKHREAFCRAALDFLRAEQALLSQPGDHSGARSRCSSLSVAKSAKSAAARSGVPGGLRRWTGSETGSKRSSRSWRRPAFTSSAIWWLSARTTPKPSSAASMAG